MSLQRNRIIPSLEGLFIGPCPATGYNFVDSQGQPHNDAENEFASGYANLIFQIPRVTSCNYGINVQRTRLLTLGKAGTAANVLLTPPTVDISFSYYNIGLIQESRLGFYVNYTDPITNQPVFPDTFNVCLISGFLARENIGTQTMRPYWPSDSRDCRNLFVGIAKQKGDLNYRTGNSIDVIGFGNCYLTSYKTSCAVDAFPHTDVTYAGEHMRFDTSGFLFNTPAIDTRSYSGIQDVICTIPSGFRDFLPTILLPKDITLSFWEASSDFGFNPQELAIQSYEIGIELNRDSLTNLGYHVPMDRPVRLPVPVTLSFDNILNSIPTGQLQSHFSTDKAYNLDLRIQVTRFTTGDIFYYFRNLKFNGATIQNGGGGHKIARYNFETELDPEDYTKGLFISGILGYAISGFSFTSDVGTIIHLNGNLIEYDTPGVPGYILAEDGSRLLQESSSVPAY